MPVIDTPSHPTVVYRISEMESRENNFIFIPNQLTAQADHDTSEANNTE